MPTYDPETATSCHGWVWHRTPRDTAGATTGLGQLSDLTVRGTWEWGPEGSGPTRQRLLSVRPRSRTVQVSPARDNLTTLTAAVLEIAAELVDAHGWAGPGPPWRPAQERWAAQDAWRLCVFGAISKAQLRLISRHPEARISYVVRRYRPAVG